jgi:hypothetical protein
MFYVLFLRLKFEREEKRGGKERYSEESVV